MDFIKTQEQFWFIFPLPIKGCALSPVPQSLAFDRLTGSYRLPPSFITGTEYYGFYKNTSLKLK